MGCRAHESEVPQPSFSLQSIETCGVEILWSMGLEPMNQFKVIWKKETVDAACPFHVPFNSKPHSSRQRITSTPHPIPIACQHLGAQLRLQTHHSWMLSHRWLCNNPNLVALSTGLMSAVMIHSEFEEVKRWSQQPKILRIKNSCSMIATKTQNKVIGTRCRRQGQFGVCGNRYVEDALKYSSPLLQIRGISPFCQVLMVSIWEIGHRYLSCCYQLMVAALTICTTSTLLIPETRRIAAFAELTEFCLHTST